MAAIVGRLGGLKGCWTDRMYDENDEAMGNSTAKPRFYGPFAQLAKFFVESGLGTEEEAYVCFIPAFKEKIKSLKYARAIIWKIKLFCEYPFGLQC